MTDVERQIAELSERIEALELSVWSLEVSDQRNWDLIRAADSDMQLLAEANGINLPKLKRFFNEARRMLNERDSNAD